MPKELTRDCASDAFRFWAFVEQLRGRVPDPAGPDGRVDVVEKYKRLLTADIPKPPPDGARAGPGDPTAQRVIAMERRLEAARAAILDLEAVRSTLLWLEKQPDGGEVVRAVREVYMRDAQRSPDRHTIRDRSMRQAEELSLSPNTVYRRLKKARCRWAVERGMRVFEAKGFE